MKKFLLPFIDKSFSFSPKKPFQILAERLPAEAPARASHAGGSAQAGPSQFRSDIFKYTPPVGKSRCWLARYAGEPMTSFPNWRRGDYSNWVGRTDPSTLFMKIC